ncbi:hypothetical protein CsSME_00048389 [Camellia sinensis var. sinensis]
MTIGGLSGLIILKVAAVANDGAEVCESLVLWWFPGWSGLHIFLINICIGLHYLLALHSSASNPDLLDGLEKPTNPANRAICSGGMHGYRSLCSGDPCPPIFRSPISGMEDIMDNQVICAIYRFPDAHKHITRPPAGVIFLKKSIEIGDLKPDHVLWHGDNGRKPWENQRYTKLFARSPWKHFWPAAR